MEKKTIVTDRAPVAIGPYSQGVAAGRMLFVSGQLGFDPQTGEFVNGDLAGQARQALENMKQILVAGGCGLENVVSVDVFLADMNDFAAFNSIYAEYFTESPPARAAVEVSRLPRDARVEIRCIAVKG